MIFRKNPSVESDLISSLGRGAHDVGVGALIGGNLFGRMAMHPSLAEVEDERERGRVLNRSWQRYGPVNTAALAAVLAGWAGARVEEARPGMLSERERRLALAKDAAVSAVTLTGLGTIVAGILFSQTSPEGAVPMETGERTAPEASEQSDRLKQLVNTLGALQLGSAIALAVVNAALAQANFRRPPVRRLLRRRY